MKVNAKLLEQRFDDFVIFIRSKGEEFDTFRSCQYFQKEEGYKEVIFKDARETITEAKWKQEDVGTGRIHKTLQVSIKEKVIDNYVEVDNNLVNNWRIKDNFSKFKSTRAFEQLLFDFYKDKGVKKERVFEELKNYGHPYNLIAYLFFIKDKNAFLPISQEKFDKIFAEDLGITDFRTNSNASWDNYATFIDIIKEVKDFLRNKDRSTTLLDAHSFLWILGGRMKSEGFKAPERSIIIQTPLPNPEIPAPSPDAEASIAQEDDEESFQEGKEKYRTHLLKERSGQLVRAAKYKGLSNDSKLCCQVCGFSFVEKYGEIGEGFIEAHHLYPISELTKETETKIEDLILVCSNCHRMLHRKRPWTTLETLKTMLQ
jgi:predicted HNH restriction endonuclease